MRRPCRHIAAGATALSLVAVAPAQFDATSHSDTILFRHEDFLKLPWSPYSAATKLTCCDEPQCGQLNFRARSNPSSRLAGTLTWLLQLPHVTCSTVGSIVAAFRPPPAPRPSWPTDPPTTHAYTQQDQPYVCVVNSTLTPQAGRA